MTEYEADFRGSVTDIKLMCRREQTGGTDWHKEAFVSVPYNFCDESNLLQQTSMQLLNQHQTEQTV